MNTTLRWLARIGVFLLVMSLALFFPSNEDGPGIIAIFLVACCAAVAVGGKRRITSRPRPVGTTSRTSNTSTDPRV